MAKRKSFDTDEFRMYLIIDKNRLDDEMIRQPSLMCEVSEAFAVAVAERDTLKEGLKILQAELYAKHRTKLGKGEERVTEGMVAAAVQADSKYLEAHADLIAADEAVGKLSALKDAFHQRSYMLRELAGLYMSNYFTRNSAEGNHTTEQAGYRSRRERINEERTKRSRL